MARITVATAVAKTKGATVAILSCGTSYSLAFAITVAVAVNNIYIEQFRFKSIKKSGWKHVFHPYFILLYSLV